MPRYQRYQQDDDDDDNQQPDQQQDDEDDDNRQGQQQDDDNNDSDGQRGQTQRRQQGDEDDDENDNNNANLRGGKVPDDDDENTNASWREQPQDDDDDDDEQREKASQPQDDDDDDDEQREKASQQQDDDYDAGNSRRTSRKGLQQADDDDDDEGRTKAQDDDDDDDEQKASKSSNVNINLNINLGGDLEDSELHEGGMMFSKKLLAQLFSGPGEHDPDEEEVPMHQIQHEHVETGDSGEWTIVELKTRDARGATIYLKAKLDSGADDNFMSFDIYEVTGLDFTAYEGPEGPPSFKMGGGQQSQPLGTVRLEYTAGKKPQKFIETFQVLEGLPHDVIIGKPLMTRAHMMMVNPNFANPPAHPALLLLERLPKDKASKAKAEAFQKQRAAEQAAAYQVKLKAQGAPKSGMKHSFR